MTVRLIERIAPPAALLLACLSLGCNADGIALLPPREPATDDPAIAPPPAVDDRTPEQWLAEIDDATKNAEQVADLLGRGVNYQLRRREFAEHVRRGAAAAEALAAHPQADQHHVTQAGLRRVHLLYVGALEDRETFLPDLQQTVNELLRTDPQGDPAVLGESLLLAITVAEDESLGHREKLQHIADFATRRDHAAASLYLYLHYAKRTEKAGDVEATVDCYRDVVANYPDSPEVREVARRLSAIEAAQGRQAAQRAAWAARVAAVKRRLGRETGYFVIYSRERNKSFYRFEYDVLRGADDAAAHVLRLPEDWEWEVSGCFPDSSEGLAAATALRGKLSKQGILIPTFN